MLIVSTSSNALLVRGQGHWVFKASASFLQKDLPVDLASLDLPSACKGFFPKSPWALGMVLAE